MRAAPHRRGFLRAISPIALACTLAPVLVAAVPTSASAQSSWPDRPIRVVVPYAAGQGADVLMRLVGQEISASLGQPVVVENRPGAGGNIGTAAVARAAPDGHTFLLGTNATNAANEFLYSNAGFKSATDFVGVGMIGLLPMVISASAAEPGIGSIGDLIDRARAKPDALNVGLPSTTARVVFAQFVKAAKAPLFGVTYKSSGQSMTDAIGGQIPLVIDTVTATRPQLAAGKLRALGITSLKSSSALLPGVKSVAEQGVPGFDVVAWDALFAPQGTSPEIVRKLSEHLQRALQRPEVASRLRDIGIEPLYMGPAELDAFVTAERVKWGGIIAAANIRID